jgi:uncharacterized protein (DUF2147 family)
VTALKRVSPGTEEAFLNSRTMRWLQGPAMAALAIVLAMAMPLRADAADITGVWQQIDDETNELQSLVAIRRANGIYEGTITKLFPKPGEPANPLCDECKGGLKNAPIIGLKIIANMKRHGDVYDGGTILDPDEGNVYSALLKPSEDGRTLTVTGYIGAPRFGRSQIWKRVQ